MPDSLAELMTPTNPAEFWAMVVGVATVGLVVVAAFGLRSLHLAKKNIRTRAQREALLLSAARLEEFSQDLIPRNNNIRNRSREADVDVFVESPGEVDFAGTDKREMLKARRWVMNYPKEVRDDALQFLNDLEAWASYFMNGLADESVAYEPCGAPFCSIVIQQYGFLVALRSQKTSGDYPNTVSLFNAWRGRLDRDQRGQAVKKLMDRIHDLRRGDVVEHEVPPPVGTELD